MGMSLSKNAFLRMKFAVSLKDAGRLLPVKFPKCESASARAVLLRVPVPPSTNSAYAGAAPVAARNSRSGARKMVPSKGMAMWSAIHVFMVSVASAPSI